MLRHGFNRILQFRHRDVIVVYEKLASMDCVNANSMTNVRQWNNTRRGPCHSKVWQNLAKSSHWNSEDMYKYVLRELVCAHITMEGIAQ